MFFIALLQNLYGALLMSHLIAPPINFQDMFSDWLGGTDKETYLKWSSCYLLDNMAVSK
jgi:hypothetical protein